MLKSDSTISLSSIVSEPVPKCIICLEEEGSLPEPILNSFEQKICQCSFGYHEKCLADWHQKHSTQCPMCRSTNFSLYKIKETFSLECTAYQKILLIVSFLCILSLGIGMVVQLSK
jgi:hypothetical protein